MMDTSEQYIKMCEKATEIQELKPVPSHTEGWDRNYTSFFYLPSSDSVEILKWDNDEQHPIIGGYASDEAGAIWLPRQDQLQEMVLPDWGKEKDAWGDPIEPDYKTDYVFWLVRKFADSIQERKRSQQTMEQLWLAFVMKEKYNKIWDGEDWHDVRQVRRANGALTATYSN